MGMKLLTDTIFRRLTETGSRLNATVKIAMGNDGVIYVDGKSSPSMVTNENKPADCTIKLSLGDLGDIMDGRLNTNTAFMTGRLRVEGNMAVAVSFGKIMGSA